MPQPVVRYFSLPNGDKIMGLRESTLCAGLKAANLALKAERRHLVGDRMTTKVNKRDEVERQAKMAMTKDLTSLANALDDFLSGEIRQGVITSWKLTLIVQARTLQALAERAIRDVPEVSMRGD